MATWLATVGGLLLSAASTAFAGDTVAPTRDGNHGAGADVVAKGTGFGVPRHVIAGGGGSSSGGAFAVSGTIGQVDADPLHPATGGVFGVSGGFWSGIEPAAPPDDDVFANGFEPPGP